MAQLRGTTTLWDAQAAVAQNGATPEAYIDTAPYVAVFIQSSVTGTFDIEAAGAKGGGSGRNTDPSFWSKYKTGIAVTGGIPLCVELSPFTPPYLRVVRTDAGGASVVTVEVFAVSI